MTTKELPDASWDLLLRVGLERLSGSYEVKCASPLVTNGLAREANGGLALSSAGEQTLKARVRLPDGTPELAAARNAFEVIAPIYAEIDATITEWEGRRPASDRTTAWRDPGVKRIAVLDRELTNVLEDLVRGVPQAALFATRLGEARDHVKRGDFDYIGCVLLDSYTTICWQLVRWLGWVTGQDESASSSSV